MQRMSDKLILLNYLEKTSEHYFIPEYTYLPIYLPIKTF